MYSDLAWTEPIVAPPEKYIEETNLYSKVIKKYSKNKVKTLLHFGCGAGFNDYTFKKHFTRGARQCSDLSDSEKSICMLNAKMMAKKIQFGALKDSMNKCKKARDPRRCSEKVSKKLKKISGEIKYFQDNDQ